jgi:hypothetical protein
MPKLAGHPPAPGDRPESEAPEGMPLVRLTWAQAERVRAHGGQVYYLATGRSYRWSASIADVRAHPTPCMQRRAAAAEAAHEAAQAKTELERRAEALAAQAQVRPSCIRVVAERYYAGPWPLTAWRLAVTERLHDCAGAMCSALPDDDGEAVARLRQRQAMHDAVYHAPRA